MKRRVLLFGFGTGALLLAVMYYPLYLVVPGWYVKDWQTASNWLGGALTVAALLLTLVGGLLAALFGGSSNRAQVTWDGALAGGIAGLLLYWGLGGSALGVMGHGAMLAYGVQTATSETQFLTLLIEAVLRTVAWSYSGFWSALLLGAALGALGGTLAPPRPHKVSESHTEIWLPVAFIGLTAAALTLITAVAVFALLPAAVEKSIQDAAITPSMSTNVIRFFPNATAMLVFLMFLGWSGWLAWREGLQSESQRVRTAAIIALVSGIVTIMTIGLILVMNTEIAISPLMLLAEAGSVALAVALLAWGFRRLPQGGIVFSNPKQAAAWQIGLFLVYPLAVFFLLLALINLQDSWLWLICGSSLLLYGGLLYLAKRLNALQTKTHPAEWVDYALFWRKNALSVGLWGGFAAFTASFAGMTSTALSLVLIAIVMIDPLNPAGATAAAKLTTVGIVQSLYRTQAVTLLIGLIATLLLTTGMVYLIFVVLRGFARRTPGAAVAVIPPVAPEIPGQVVEKKP